MHRGGVRRREAGKHDAPGVARYGVGIVPHATSEPPRRGRARIAVLVIIIVIIGVIIWSNKHLTNEYALTPGVAQPVGPLITISGHPHSATRRSILLTDVYLTQLTSWQLFIDTYIDPPAHEEMVSGSQLVGPDVPTAELYNQGYLQMYDSQNDAKAAAMRALDLAVTDRSVGVTVVLVPVNAPAFHVVSVADRIVWARGHAVSSRCGLIDALAGAVPGQPVALRVERAHFASDGAITGYSRPKPVESPTSAVPIADQGQTGCAGHPSESVFLGIELENAFQWHFPVGVSINTADIGGPSAGLAMTLGIIDALSRTPITGDLKIAATGTIDPLGNVGEIGGAAEKTIAVENAGATVFLVPTSNLADAKSTASPGLTVIGVNTLDQALAVIYRLGGTKPVLI